MHDLRWDQHDAAVTHAVLRGKTFVTPTIDTVQQLRTVPMPELRTPQARTLDAAARGLDCRTADDKLRAELVRLVDCLQSLTLRVDVFVEEQARVIAELTAYIRDHSEADE